MAAKTTINFINEIRFSWVESTITVWEYTLSRKISNFVMLQACQVKQGHLQVVCGVTSVTR